MKRQGSVIVLFLTFAATFSKADDQAVTNTANSAAEDPLWESMMKIHRKLSDDDSYGRCNYQSDQKCELAKFGYNEPVSLDSASFKSDATKALLAALPSPESFSNAPLEALRSAGKVQEAITKEQISPAWINNAWVDATRLAGNGFDCSNQLPVLSMLNCCAIRKRIDDASWGDALSHELNARVSCRMKLFYAGYVTQFDKTFGIWRITGTNSPSERPERTIR